MSLRLTLEACSDDEPIITLAAAKEYLRVDGTDNDAVITVLLQAAREAVEVFTERTLAPTTYSLWLDAFPRQGCLRLPRPPLQEVLAIVYRDPAGAEQTLATTVYQVDSIAEPGLLLLAPGQSWPATETGNINAVQITYVAGYLDTDAIPARAKVATQLLLNDMYEHREAQLEARIFCNETVQRLLWSLRILDFV